jgi:hypothetical protein
MDFREKNRMNVGREDFHMLRAKTAQFGRQKFAGRADIGFMFRVGGDRWYPDQFLILPEKIVCMFRKIFKGFI